ncbi:MAG: hypothetical protein EKK39_02105 [Sphingobacteriales bacterium]|nr:MAG: hypothetical protein EKK39_02105 [Sphingobacteriales bacterium]
MNRHYYLSVLIVLLYSCHPNEPVSEIKIGMPEDKWKSEIKKLSDKKTLVSTYNDTGVYVYEYSWKLRDTTIPATVTFNSENVPNGILRSKTLELGTFFNKPRNKNDVYCDTCYGFDFYNQMLKRKVVNRSTFNKVYDELVRIYGKEDSASSEKHRTKEYYFSSGDKNIILRGDSGSYYGYDFFSPAYLSIEAKKLDTLYARAKAEAMSHLTIKEYCDVKFESITKDYAKDSYGYDRKALVIKIADVYNYAVVDGRGVKSAKGSLQIVDDYGDALYEKTDFEIHSTSMPIYPFKRQASFYGFGAPRGYGLYIFYDSNLIPEKLRAAINLGTHISARFIPKAVLLDDGTIIN